MAVYLSIKITENKSMKLYYKVLFLCIITFPNYSLAQDFQSAFGFSSKISDNWSIITKESVSKDTEMFEQDIDEFKNVDPALLSKMKTMVLSGKMESMYYKKSDEDFNDNINIFEERNKKSNLAKRSKKLCASFPKIVKQGYNREDYTEVYFCKHIKIHDVDTISYSFDGIIYGTKIHGYYFNTKNNTINLTITCKNEKCNEVKNDAELIFKNFHL